MKETLKRIITGTLCVAAAASIITGGAIISSASRAEKKSIGSQAAIVKALEDAGVKSEDVIRSEYSFERKNGEYIFEIEFYADGKEFEYIVDADSGEIMTRRVEKDKGPRVKKKTPKAETTVKADTTTTTTTTRESKPEEKTTKTTTTNPTVKKNYIDIEKAKQIALADAGTNASNVVFKKAHADFDDGIRIYEIEFVGNSKEYEYEINAQTGKIIKKEVDAKSVVAKKTETTTQTTKNRMFISVEQAKQTALNHAKLTSSDVRFTKVKLDRDDGRTTYEIEFISGIYEYEYEINARTGKIVDFDKDIID